MRHCDGAGADRDPLAPVQSVGHLSASILATKRPGRPSDFNGSSAAGRVMHCIGQCLASERHIDPQAVGEIEDHDTSTDDVFRKLAMLEEQHAQATFVSQNTPAKAQVSPWLERTRWPNYLNGVRLAEVARLARLPEP